MRVPSAGRHEDEVNVCEVPGLSTAPLNLYYVLIQNN